MCLASESTVQTHVHRRGPDFPGPNPRLAVLSEKLNPGDLGRPVPPDLSSDVYMQMVRSQGSTGQRAFLHAGHRLDFSSSSELLGVLLEQVFPPSPGISSSSSSSWPPTLPPPVSHFLQLRVSSSPPLPPFPCLPHSCAANQDQHTYILREDSV